MSDAFLANATHRSMGPAPDNLSTDPAASIAMSQELVIQPLTRCRRMMARAARTSGKENRSTIDYYQLVRVPDFSGVTRYGVWV